MLTFVGGTLCYFWFQNAGIEIYDEWAENRAREQTPKILVQNKLGQNPYVLIFCSKIHIEKEFPKIITTNEYGFLPLDLTLPEETVVEQFYSLDAKGNKLNYYKSGSAGFCTMMYREDLQMNSKLRMNLIYKSLDKEIIEQNIKSGIHLENIILSLKDFER